MFRRDRPRWGHPRPFERPGPFDDERRAGPKGGPPWGGPPWGGPPFGDDPSGEGPPWGGPRRRQRRGDIKFALLELLAERPRHGYELIKELEQRFGGFYRPSPGTVYPTLQLLEEEGHLTAAEVDGKKVYTVSDSGRRLLEERRAEGEGHGRRGGPWGRGPSPGGHPELHELRSRVQALLAVVQQVAQHGTPEQLRAAIEQLDGTRRELYRILAGDDRPAAS
jgi:DNA-binding PadR family transcriptional regulator